MVLQLQSKDSHYHFPSDHYLLPQVLGVNGLIFMILFSPHNPSLNEVRVRRMRKPTGMKKMKDY